MAGTGAGDFLPGFGPAFVGVFSVFFVPRGFLLFNVFPPFFSLLVEG
jgi:hypothetical protein